ncbi:hypothetical protein [Aliamphritea spongicola]|nr:hypothetical protein [Aliamphritea spongicola]
MSVSGEIHTAIHFEKDADPDTAVQVEAQALANGEDSGAFNRLLAQALILPDRLLAQAVTLLRGFFYAAVIYKPFGAYRKSALQIHRLSAVIAVTHC